MEWQVKLNTEWKTFPDEDADRFTKASERGETRSTVLVKTLEHPDERLHIVDFELMKQYPAAPAPTLAGATHPAPAGLHPEARDIRRRKPMITAETLPRRRRYY